MSVRFARNLMADIEFSPKTVSPDPTFFVPASLRQSSTKVQPLPSMHPDTVAMQFELYGNFIKNPCECIFNSDIYGLVSALP
jgi:hypothetical protein